MIDDWMFLMLINDHAHGCPWMSTNAHQYPWMLINVHECPWMSMNVYECLSMSMNCSWMSMPMAVYMCLWITGAQSWTIQEYLKLFFFSLYGSAAYINSSLWVTPTVLNFPGSAGSYATTPAFDVSSASFSISIWINTASGAFQPIYNYWWKPYIFTFYVEISAVHVDLRKNSDHLADQASADSSV